MIDKFNSSAIAELKLTDGTTCLELRKNSIAKQELQAAEDHATRLGISTGEGSGISSGSETIKSPIVATFYAAPGPDAPPFAKPGSKIKAGQTLCILEAMKMMNRLEAEFDCEIIEVHVSNGEMVEYGQELYTVKRN